jgi:hypothetical protein
MAIASLHLDPYSVAKAEEGSIGGTSGDYFDHPDLSDAGISEASLPDRTPGAAVGALVRHGAGPDDGSPCQGARLRSVHDESGEVEGHVNTGIRPAERLAVEVHVQREMDFSAIERRA